MSMAIDSLSIANYVNTASSKAGASASRLSSGEGGGSSAAAGGVSVQINIELLKKSREINAQQAMQLIESIK